MPRSMRDNSVLNWAGQREVASRHVATRSPRAPPDSPARHRPRAAPAATLGFGNVVCAERLIAITSVVVGDYRARRESLVDAEQAPPIGRKIARTTATKKI